MNLTTPRRLAALVPVLAVTLAAGCGGSDDADFVDGYNAAVAPLSTLMTDLGSAQADDPAAAGKTLDQLADGLDGVRTELAALEPPADAADELDRMLGALGQGTKQVRAMATAATDGDVGKLTKATQRFSEAGTELVTIEEQLRTAVDG